MNRYRYFNATIIVLLVGYHLSLRPQCAHAEKQTLWQIGKFDHSSEEFGVSFGFGSLSSIRPDCVYRIGSSTPSQDWSGFQPGSSNVPAGAREHPFTVLFSLPGPPRGIYQLSIGVMPYMPRRPNLRVEINGKQGIFYLRPQISYDLGNFPTAFIPQYSYQKLTFQIPTTALKQGENKLVLTCIDDPSGRDDGYGTVGIGDSGIFYDALELSQDEIGKFQPRSIRASVAPTVFYKQGSSGLTEVVEAIISLNERVPKGTAALEVPGWHQSANLSSGPDFGEQLTAFDVPEWNGSVDARLRVRATETRNFDVSSSPRRLRRCSHN